MGSKLIVNNGDFEYFSLIYLPANDMMLGIGHPG
jgi:hypothetical protein